MGGISKSVSPDEYINKYDLSMQSSLLNHKRKKLLIKASLYINL